MSVEMTIEEIVAHCDRQLSREPKGSIFYREHEAVKAFLMELQEFRNIGMKPEEIKEHEAAYNECLTRTYGPFKQKISQWLQAEQDGKLVLLPCKVGDTVYRIYDDCELPGDCGTKMKCKGCEYRNLFIEEQAFCISMLSQNGTLGRPYYLTRAEAEQKLHDIKSELDATASEREQED